MKIRTHLGEDGKQPEGGGRPSKDSEENYNLISDPGPADGFTFLHAQTTSHRKRPRSSESGGKKPARDTGLLDRRAARARGQFLHEAGAPLCPLPAQLPAGRAADCSDSGLWDPLACICLHPCRLTFQNGGLQASNLPGGGFVFFFIKKKKMSLLIFCFRERGGERENHGYEKYLSGRRPLQAASPGLSELTAAVVAEHCGGAGGQPSAQQPPVTTPVPWGPAAAQEQRGAAAGSGRWHHGPGVHQELDRWMAQLNECKQLSAPQVKSLCRRLKKS